MPFLYVTAKLSSTINYNTQPQHIRVMHTMTNFLRHYFTSRLAEFLALSNSPHNDNIFPFPSKKSNGMRRSGGWGGTLLLWGEPELPACWKNKCQSSQGLDELMISHPLVCQTSVVAMVSPPAPPLLWTWMHLNFAIIWPGAAWGARGNHSAKGCVK